MESLKLQHQLDNLKSLENFAQNHFCRLPVILNGSMASKNLLLEKFFEGKNKQSIAWVSDKTPKPHQNLQHLKAVNVIGKEYQFIVYDLEHELDPNLFAALCGTLRGGGLLLLLIPSSSEWLTTLKSHNNWFMWRFVEKLTTSNLVTQLNLDTENDPLNTDHLNLKKQSTANQLNEQQDQAVQKIIHVVKGHRNRPLVLLADRGRGKSAALGIAASELLKEYKKNIIITAPSLDACEIVFKHLKINLPDATFHTGKVGIGTSSLRFMSPDALLTSETKTDLLIIDEASGVPIPILENLLKKHSRIIFASTIHGYEGSGHCFSIKFFKHLDKLTPDWKKFHMESPMRWCDLDPLEKLINQLFLLKPENDISISDIKLDQLEIEKISTRKLVENESLLSEFYNLLSSAHYKTQPSDLKQIINNEDITLYLVKKDSSLVAAAFTINEGQLDKEISEQIYLGNRRPKGHITPQSLLMHLGIKNAGQLSYLRIMRIAVRPEIQNQGIGSHLLKHIQNDAKSQNIDFISCSFGASKELLNYWGKHSFSLVRIGHHKKSQINAYAALMLQALSTAATPILSQASAHFKNNFPCLLKENLINLDSDISLKIFRDFISLPESNITEKDWLSLKLFANNNQTYEDNIYVINLFSQFALCQDKTHIKLSKLALDLLILKSMYGKSWKELSEDLKLGGKNQANSLFKKSISSLITLYK